MHLQRRVVVREARKGSGEVREVGSVEGQGADVLVDSKGSLGNLERAASSTASRKKFSILLNRALICVVQDGKVRRSGWLSIEPFAYNTICICH